MLIDVSNHQGTINWAAADPAIDGAYVKVTEGTGYVDPFWRRNHDAVMVGSRPVGAYHFADLGDPVAEADYFAAQYMQATWQLRPVLDIETGGANAGWIQAFRAQFRARTGTTPFRVYTSQGFLTGALSPGAWIDPDTDIWVARYASTPGFDHPQLVLWQNTETASVPGIVGNVDADQYMHGWTPAADGDDMDYTTTYTDWAGNSQTLKSHNDIEDQRLIDVQNKLNDLHKVLVEPGTVVAHDPTKTKTNLADLIADTAAWTIAQGGQLTAIQGTVTAEEAHLLAAFKGASTGQVDVNALAAVAAPAIAALLPKTTSPDDFVAALAAHLAK